MSVAAAEYARQIFFSHQVSIAPYIENKIHFLELLSSSQGAAEWIRSDPIKCICIINQFLAFTPFDLQLLERIKKVFYDNFRTLDWAARPYYWNFLNQVHLNFVYQDYLILEPDEILKARSLQIFSCVERNPDHFIKLLQKKDNEGNTLLHHNLKYLPLIGALFSEKISREIRANLLLDENIQGLTPLDLAIQRGESEIFSMFASWKEPPYAYFLVCLRNIQQKQEALLNIILYWFQQCDYTIAHAWWLAMPTGGISFCNLPRFNTFATDEEEESFIYYFSFIKNASVNMPIVLVGLGRYAEAERLLNNFDSSCKRRTCTYICQHLIWLFEKYKEQDLLDKLEKFAYLTSLAGPVALEVAYAFIRHSRSEAAEKIIEEAQPDVRIFVKISFEMKRKILEWAVSSRKNDSILKNLQKLDPAGIRSFVNTLFQKDSITIYFERKQGVIATLSFYKENMTASNFKEFFFTAVMRRAPSEVIRYLYQNDPKKEQGVVFGMRTQELVLHVARNWDMHKCQVLFECDPRAFKSTFEDLDYLKKIVACNRGEIFQFLEKWVSDAWNKLLEPVLATSVCFNEHYDIRINILNQIGNKEIIPFIRINALRSSNIERAIAETRILLQDQNASVESVIRKFPFLKKIEAFLLCCAGRVEDVQKRLIHCSQPPNETIPSLHDLLCFIRQTQSFEVIENMYPLLPEDLQKVLALEWLPTQDVRTLKGNLQLLQNLQILVVERPETHQFILPILGELISDHPSREELSFAANLPKCITEIMKIKGYKIFPKLAPEIVHEFTLEEMQMYYVSILEAQGRLGLNKAHLQRSLDVLPKLPKHPPHNDINILIDLFEDFRRKYEDTLAAEIRFSEFSGNKEDQFISGFKQLLDFVNKKRARLTKDEILFKDATLMSNLRIMMQCCIDKLKDSKVPIKKKAKGYILLAESGHHCSGGIMNAVFDVYDLFSSLENFTAEQMVLKVLEQLRLEKIEYHVCEEITKARAANPDSYIHTDSIHTKFNLIKAFPRQNLAIRLADLITYDDPYENTGLQFTREKAEKLFSKSYDPDAVLNKIQHVIGDAGVIEHFTQNPPQRFLKDQSDREDAGMAYAIEIRSSPKLTQRAYICLMLEDLNVFNSN